AFDRCARTQELSLKETEAILRNKKSVQTFVDSFRQDNPVSKPAPATQKQLADVVGTIGKTLAVFIAAAQHIQETHATLLKIQSNTNPVKTIGWSIVVGAGLIAVATVANPYLSAIAEKLGFKKSGDEVSKPQSQCPPNVYIYQAPQGAYWFPKGMPPFLIPRYPDDAGPPDQAKPKLEP
ncbi:MAG: hypothetical protein FWF24_02360, partial [Alphaproteobacteria bacterium]|nr:hypothetical protein [Alphaproteobacteria bacterium]